MTCFVGNKSERLGDESLTPASLLLFPWARYEGFRKHHPTTATASWKMPFRTQIWPMEQNGGRCVCSSILKNRERRIQNMLGTVLLVIVVLLLIGALPNWGHSRSWGYGPSGGLGLVLVIVLILLLMGRI
jgi:hypothetical protein